MSCELTNVYDNYDSWIIAYSDSSSASFECDFSHPYFNLTTLPDLTEITFQYTKIINNPPPFPDTHLVEYCKVGKDWVDYYYSLNSTVKNRLDHLNDIQFIGSDCYINGVSVGKISIDSNVEIIISGVPGQIDTFWTLDKSYISAWMYSQSLSRIIPGISKFESFFKSFVPVYNGSSKPIIANGISRVQDGIFKTIQSKSKLYIVHGEKVVVGQINGYKITVMANQAKNDAQVIIGYMGRSSPLTFSDQNLLVVKTLNGASLPTKVLKQVRGHNWGYVYDLSLVFQADLVSGENVFYLVTDTIQPSFEPSSSEILADTFTYTDYDNNPDSCGVFATNENSFTATCNQCADDNGIYDWDANINVDKPLIIEAKLNADLVDPSWDEIEIGFYTPNLSIRSAQYFHAPYNESFTADVYFNTDFRIDIYFDYYTLGDKAIVSGLRAYYNDPAIDNVSLDTTSTTMNVYAYLPNTVSASNGLLQSTITLNDSKSILANSKIQSRALSLLSECNTLNENLSLIKERPTLNECAISIKEYPPLAQLPSVINKGIQHGSQFLSSILFNVNPQPYFISSLHINLNYEYVFKSNIKQYLNLSRCIINVGERETVYSPIKLQQDTTQSITLSPTDVKTIHYYGEIPVVGVRYSTDAQLAERYVTLTSTLRTESDGTVQEPAKGEIIVIARWMEKYRLSTSSDEGYQDIWRLSL